MAMVWLLLCVFLTVQGLEPETVFVKRGEDLRLAGPETVNLEEEEQFLWKHNQKNNIIRFPSLKDVVFKKYKDKAEFVKESHSLLMKKMNHSDSGEYTAVISGSNEKEVRRYQVHVLDPVGPVHLVFVNATQSGDICDLNVTCGPINGSIKCRYSTCSHVHVNHSGSTYRIYNKNSKIICNHSNPVSSAKDSKGLRDLCGPDFKLIDPRPSPTTPPSPPSPILLSIIITTILIVIALSIAIFIYKRRRKNTNTSGTNHEVHESLSLQDTAPNIYHEAQPDTTYSMVQPHVGPAPKDPSPEDPSPETLYAPVNKNAARQTAA